MMVCAVRLGTCNRRSRKELPSPHFLVSGLFAHDHTPQTYTHTHTSIHTYNRNTHTHAHTQPHTHTQITHTHTSHLDTTHTTHMYTIIHASYTHTQIRTCTHTHAYPPPNSISTSLLPLRSLLHFYFSFIVLWKKLTCGVIRSFNCFCQGGDTRSNSFQELGQF